MIIHSSLSPGHLVSRLFSISAVARELNVSMGSVYYWIEKGIIEPPSLEGAGARLFTQAQLEDIRNIITQRRSRRSKKSTQAMPVGSVE